MLTGSVDGCMNFPLQQFSYWPGIEPALRLALARFEAEACPYLPGRVATFRGVWSPRQMQPEVYALFLDAGFRRSGRVVYQPVCDGCRECRPVRVPVATFRASTSQRRAAKRNADVVVSIVVPKLTDEKFALYRRYVATWHGRESDLSDDVARERLCEFLYDSPTETIEIEHRLADGKLVGVGICDVTPNVLSSVYFYFDPDESRRSLGTFGALAEIEIARERGVAFYHLGFWVRDCAAMAYKATFRPNDLLCGDREWRENVEQPLV